MKALAPSFWESFFIKLGADHLRSNGSPENLSAAYRDYCKPGLQSALALCKLDVNYVKAQGDHLFLNPLEFSRPRVVDFLGGYGSTILGHNPEAVKRAIIEAMERDLPVHAQASIRGGAALLAQKLNQLVSTTSIASPAKYFVHLLSSGTEATEAALKHALMEWNQKRQRALAALEKLETRVRMKNASEESLRPLGARRDAVLSAAPVFLALRGSFHGKTAGSLAVTANPAHSEMYPEPAVKTVFLDRNATDETIRETFAALAIDLETRKFSTIAGVLYEPVQGEGGIFPIAARVISTLREESRAYDIPLIADEIQSGLYRTGRFLASETYGFLPDYIILGKSLGGSMAKISALLIHEEHYQDDFGVKHTSTFAEDDLSAVAALKTLELLGERSEGIAARARDFERMIKGRVEELQKRYPGVIAESRGVGFMLGVEIDATLRERSSHFYEVLDGSGYLCYILASYLLHRHRIRVGVTLSQSNTIRLEPSADISDDAIELLLIGLEDLAEKLYEGRLYELIHHLIPDEVATTSLETPVFVRSPARQPLIKVSAETRRVAFLCHFVDANHLAKLDPTFKAMSEAERAYFLDSLGPSGKSSLVHQQVIGGGNGAKILFELQGIFCGSQFFEQSLRRGNSEAVQKVREAYGQAACRGSTHVGLGQYTSIVTKNGKALPSAGPYLTTGNSLTVGLALEGLKRLVKSRGHNLSEMHVGVVGVAGNICNVYAQILADDVREMTVIHREPLNSSLKFRTAVSDILRNSKIPSDRLHPTSELSALTQCDAIVLGTNASRSLLFPEHLKPGALVLDISVPSNVDSRVHTERPDVHCVMGGLAQLPLGQKLDTPIVFAGNGEIFACMAETITLGLMNYPGSYSLGDLSKSQVLEIVRMAKEAGIELGSLKQLSSL